MLTHVNTTRASPACGKGDNVHGVLICVNGVHHLTFLISPDIRRDPENPESPEITKIPTSIQKVRRKPQGFLEMKRGDLGI